MPPPPHTAAKEAREPPSYAYTPPPPPHIGPHLSVGKGYEQVGKAALAIRADTFSVFLRNPRGSKARELNVDDIHALNIMLREHRFAPIVAHAPYTMNLATENEETRQFSAQMLAEDLTRMEYLPGNCYNLHPGSFHPSPGQRDDEARTEAATRVAGMLNLVLRPGMHTTLLLETMAGGSKEVGSRFEGLRAILDRVKYPHMVGVCLDSCHLFAAGYDIRGNLDGVLAEFDRVVGLDKLRAVHLNDSVFPLGSGRDRHANLGEGAIGLEALVRMTMHPALRQLPFITETHLDLTGHANEIAQVRKTYAILTGKRKEKRHGNRT